MEIHNDGNMRSVELAFSRPFGWSDDEAVENIDDSHSSIVMKGGVYLWTVMTPIHDELVCYVGQTGEFKERFRKHHTEQLNGFDRVYDPDSYVGGVRGKENRLWGGDWGRYKEPRDDFKTRFERIKPVASRLANLFRFYLAPISPKQADMLGEKEFRIRLEAALAHHFYMQGGIVGNFQEEDNIYLDGSSMPSVRLEGLHWPPDNKTTRVICHTDAKIRGFPGPDDIEV